MEDTMSKYTDSIEHNCEGIDNISPGICYTCEQCQSNYNMEADELMEAMDTQEVIDEGSFSWSSCDTCGSGLGGNRYIAHGRIRGGINMYGIIHLEICTDCLMYFANGDEPENWK